MKLARSAARRSRIRLDRRSPRSRHEQVLAERPPVIGQDQGLPRLWGQGGVTLSRTLLDTVHARGAV